MSAFVHFQTGTSKVELVIEQRKHAQARGSTGELSLSFSRIYVLYIPILTMMFWTV